MTAPNPRFRPCRRKANPLSENPYPREHPNPLPNTARLFEVWDGVQDAASQLEHATRVFVTLWTIQLAEVDLHAVTDWTFTEQRAAVAETAAAIARAIDDEVTWYLGNHSGKVTLIADDTGTVTIGELLGLLTMYAVLFDKSPGDPDIHPLRTTFLVLAHLYDSMTTALMTGSAHQPRRRSHGAPPIPPPRRIDLTTAPTPTKS